MNKKLPLQWGIHLTTFLQGFLNNFLLLVDSTCGVSVLRWQANALWNNRKNLSEMQVIPYFPRGRQSLSFPPSMFHARTKFSPVNVARKFAFSGLQTRRTHTWSCESLSLARARYLCCLVFEQIDNGVLLIFSGSRRRCWRAGPSRAWGREGKDFSCPHVLLYSQLSLKVILHETIRRDDF